MDDLAHLLSELTKWRETEQAALQDVEDADVHVIAADLTHQEAKRRLQCVVAKVEQLNRDIRKAIDEQTAPVPELFTSEGMD